MQAGRALHPKPGAPDVARLRSLRSNLELRARTLEAIRGYFQGLGFLEVETPIRVPAPAPEAHIDAIPSGRWYLAPSPELHMKRLLAAGHQRIYQVCKSFRAREQGRHHNPEFTMLEWYRAGAGYLEAIEETERLVGHVAEQVLGATAPRTGGNRLDLAPPWERLTVAEAFQRFAGWRPGPDPDAERFNLDLVERVEPMLGRNGPTVLLDYPSSMASLARLKPGAPEVAERFEVYAGGLELANGFTELTDAAEQRRRFQEEARKRQEAGHEVYPLPEAFLAALPSLPPAYGVALGVDRLVMLLTGASSIDQVMAFTVDTA
jgi:lysyl-tRNA synthetase class 2